jgi:L-alanine-DL-glutamate epimerase-like enolase superfamily enzyme
MEVEISRVNWPYASPFRIASNAWAEAQTVQVELREGNLIGRGEGLPVFYHGDTVDSMSASIERVRGEIIKGLSRTQLSALLPPGGARNAVDCALWDFEAKRAGRRAWELAGLVRVQPLTTAYTLSVDDPVAMGKAALAAVKYSLLKLKLAGEGDVERVRAVRKARPDAELIVDANQSWNERQLHAFPAELQKLGVKLIEQPLPASTDEALLKFNSPIPLCADESCQTTASLPAILGKYQFANIKLDKTGGLTGALDLARAAQKAGLKLMVGCMAGSSLAMAPAFIVGQYCAVVDLDGPLLAARDIDHGVRYEGSRMHPPDASLWG